MIIPFGEEEIDARGCLIGNGRREDERYIHINQAVLSNHIFFIRLELQSAQSSDLTGVGQIYS